MNKQNANPLLKIKEYGQSIWLDSISREIINKGKLKKLIQEDGLAGVTSNPAIFEKAIDKGEEYQDVIASLVQQDKNKEEIYEELTVQDIQNTADLLKPLFKKSQGYEGLVSLEVSPHLAHDTSKTINEARHLWQKVNRPNVMIKVPAITESIPAVKQLISEGININITLLFGLERYSEVIEAYLAGLEERVKAGKSVNTICSVASFFLSRIDVLIDPLLENISIEGGHKGDTAKSLIGQSAISNAKLAYALFKESISSERFKNLEAQGARKQRLLWASTGTKNPDFSDIKYVEPLIGRDTINTLPEKTIDAYRDHGRPEADTIEREVDQAGKNIKLLAEVGIDIDDVTRQLETEAVEKFIQPYDKLMQTLEKKIASEQGKRVAH